MDTRSRCRCSLFTECSNYLPFNCLSPPHRIRLLCAFPSVLKFSLIAYVRNLYSLLSVGHMVSPVRFHHLFTHFHVFFSTDKSIHYKPPSPPTCCCSLIATFFLNSIFLSVFHLLSCLNVLYNQNLQYFPCFLNWFRLQVCIV